MIRLDNKGVVATDANTTLFNVTGKLFILDASLFIDMLIIMKIPVIFYFVQFDILRYSNEVKGARKSCDVILRQS